MLKPRSFRLFPFYFHAKPPPPSLRLPHLSLSFLSLFLSPVPHCPPLPLLVSRIPPFFSSPSPQFLFVRHPVTLASSFAAIPQRRIPHNRINPTATSTTTSSSLVPSRTTSLAPLFFPTGPSVGCAQENTASLPPLFCSFPISRPAFASERLGSLPLGPATARFTPYHHRPFTHTSPPLVHISRAVSPNTSLVRPVFATRLFFPSLPLVSGSSAYGNLRNEQSGLVCK
mmetsp:Transcript_596/g.1154  ORF Transcript_596/g.1154 Transcript_596/m.1154 type:complete len:228 (+) Transcript_596:243-926(+)